MIRLAIIILYLTIFSVISLAQNCPSDKLTTYKEHYIRPVFKIRKKNPDEAIRNINILIKDTIPQLPIDCQSELLATSYNVKSLAEKYKAAYTSSRISIQQAIATTNSNIEKGKFYSNACDLEKIVGNYDTAFLYCNTAIELLKKDSTAEPFLAKAYINKTNIFIEQDSTHLDSIEFYVGKVKELSPDEEDIKDLEYNQAIAFVRQGRYEEAASLLDECYDYYMAKKDTLSLAKVEEVFGELHYKQEEYKKAKIHFNESIKLYRAQNPELADIDYNLLNLGLTLYELGDIKEALNTVQKIEIKEYDLWRLQSLYYKIYLKLGEREIASQYFKEALSSRIKFAERKVSSTVSVKNISTIEHEMRKSRDETFTKIATARRSDKLKTIYGFCGIIFLLVFIFYVFYKKKESEIKQQKILHKESEKKYQERLTNIFKELRESHIDEKEQTNRHIHDDICPGIVNIQREIEYHLTVKNKKDYDLSDAIKLCQLNYNKLKKLIDRNIEQKRADVEWLWHTSLIIKQQKRNNNLKVDTYFDKEGLRSIPNDLGNHLARITCVLVENVENHAKATEMSYSLVGGKEIILAIEDNGIGFDKKDLQKKQKKENASIGLRHIASRVKQMRGRIDLDTAPNQGTKITITIPVLN